MDCISKISKLLALHFSGLATETEEQALKEWLDRHPEKRGLFKCLSEDRSFRQHYLRQDKRKTVTAIRDFDRRTGKTIRWRRLLPYAAVLVIGLLVGGIWLVKNWQGQNEGDAIALIQEEIVPGTTKAVLKLSDGQLVNLSDSITGISALKNLDVNVQKGELAYAAASAAESGYNELILPRGGEYRLVLSDGSVVRLNSGSRLRYPVAFSGDRREVELSGEAFFDVATDPQHPFCVKIQGMTVKAYGTAFNINTHTPGHVYTALVRGHVGVVVESTGREYAMRPSQLADFSDKTHEVKIGDADLLPHVAWTEGRFVFVNETLEQILHTLGLWYDFEVVFEQETLRELHFSGSMRRYDQISKILDAVSYTVGVQIRQEGRILIVRQQMK